MKKCIFYFLPLAFCALFVGSNSTSQPKSLTPSLDPLVAHIDTTVRPADDFFRYANGRWFKENPIPPSEPSNGLWQLIQDTINAQVRAICESSAAIRNAEKGSNKQKIGDFFYSGMDSISLNSNGIGQLRGEFEQIDAIKDLRGVARTAAFLHTVAGSPLFGFGVGQDDRISSKNAVLIVQGGLSLPDRRFYLDTDARAVTIREKFATHLFRMYRIIGYDSTRAKNSATNVIKLETALATSSRKREDTRDPIKNYNKISFKKLLATSPELDWALFMNTVGLKDVDTVIVGQPEYLTALNGYLASYSLDDWKDYLKYHLVRGLARFLDDVTFKETFDFYSTALRGVQEPKPRWKRVVEQTDASLGELVGKVYVEEYLPKGTKEKLLEIGNAIMDVYAERIKTLDWMSDATKEKALKKLSMIIMKVGYPDKWKDLSSLEVGRTSYLRNAMHANLWRFRYMADKFGKPVDRTEWMMEPQTYNAYYNPSNNEIVVPGCNIIIPGFERTLADDALLYSVIGGSTFGHEITHGFDDQGSKYNDHGDLDNWWTAEDSARFYGKTRAIVDQFNQYVAVDTLHINGELTQGENIADLGGIMMGYQAFKKTAQYRSHEMISGLTPDQRFFLGYALAWMVDERPEAVANQVRSDEHSPAKFRVIGPLTDMPEFLQTFHIQPGDAMWRAPDKRVKIW